MSFSTRSVWVESGRILAAGLVTLLAGTAVAGPPSEPDVDRPGVVALVATEEVAEPAAGEDDSETPDWVGELATPEEVDNRANKATEWLRTHPRHAYALHVAERLYLLGRGQDDFGRLDPLREYLVVQHPRAIFTNFVARDFGAAVNNGPDRSLVGYVRRRLFPVPNESGVTPQLAWYAGKRPATDRFSPARLAPVLLVVEQALRQPDLANTLNAPDLLLSLHLARSLSPNTALRSHLRKPVAAIAAPGPDLAAVLDDTQRSATERIVEIERLRTKMMSATCNLYQEHLSTLLSDEELDSPEILAIRVERSLDTWNLRQAMTSLERLDREAPTTRRQFLRAWGMYHLGRDDEAKRALTALAGAGARGGSPFTKGATPKTATPVASSRTSAVSTDGWRRLAGESLAEMDQQRERRDEFVKNLSVPLDRLRANTYEPLLLTIVTRPSQKPGHTIHALYDARSRTLALAAHSQGKCVVGYRSTAHDSQLYLGGDATVATWNTPGQFPTATIQFGFGPSGATSHANWQTCPDPGKLASDMTLILQQPFLSSADMFSRLVHSYLAGGLLSPPVDEADGSRVWGLTYPGLRSPEWDSRRWTISATGEEWNYSGPNVTVELQQKPEVLPPELTEWTRLPTAEVPPSDIQHSFRMMSAMMELMSEVLRVMENADVAIEEGETVTR
jgi:hypothetical protein